MRLKRLSLALWAALSSSATLAEHYTVSVPVVQGDLHQARREALKLIFLEAGQTGKVQVSSSSSLIGTDLRETIRLQANYRLKTFKITEEISTSDSLQLSALVERAEAEPSACPPPSVQLRNTRLKWLPSERQEDPNAEILLRIALLESLEKAFANALLPPEDLSPAAYTVQIQPSGKLSLFSQTLQLKVSILGADQNPITQQIFPATIPKLTNEISQETGSATFKSTVISPSAQEWIHQVSQHIAGKYACLPAIAVLTPSTNRLISVPTRSENAPEPKPVVFYSLQWPLKAGGEIDLISIEGFLQVRQIEPKKITLEAPNNAEGYGETSAPVFNRGGYLLFY